MPHFVIWWFGIGLACAVITYPLELAYWQREFPTVADGREDVKRAVTVSVFHLLLPFMFAFTLLMGHAAHGMKWRAHTSEFAARNREQRKYETGVGIC